MFAVLSVGLIVFSTGVMMCLLSFVLSAGFIMLSKANLMFVRFLWKFTMCFTNDNDW